MAAAAGGGTATAPTETNTVGGAAKFEVSAFVRSALTCSTVRPPAETLPASGKLIDPSGKTQRVAVEAVVFQHFNIERIARFDPVIALRLR